MRKTSSAWIICTSFPKEMRMQDTNLIHREVHSIQCEKRGNEASKEVYRILLTKSNKTNRLRDEIYMLFILFFCICHTNYTQCGWRKCYIFLLMLFYNIIEPLSIQWKFNSYAILQAILSVEYLILGQSSLSV